jgi:hypothetical protein
MRKSTFNLNKSTKRVMALAMDKKADKNAYKKLMVDAQITYENMKHRKAKDRSDGTGE